MVTGKKQRRKFNQEDGHVDAVEEEWKQTQCYVLSVENGVTNAAQD